MNHQEDFVPLGSSELRVSPLGIGTWAWGDRLFWGYGRGGYTDADLEAAYRVSRAAGINFFDTAEIYGRGRSERLLGRFARRGSDGGGGLEHDETSRVVIVEGREDVGMGHLKRENVAGLLLAHRIGIPRLIVL